LWCGYYGREFNAALKDNGGVILEVNAAPGFRMHLPRLKVYPEMSQLLLLICILLGMCRIPIIAVTGTNGKTTLQDY
jgi:cyanophycin synthetase